MLPQRKSPRLKGYDYRQNGAYFITICTHNRQHLFGEVVEGQMRLNALGEIAQACWDDIPAHFPHVELDASVIMPNHVHGILVLADTPIQSIVSNEDYRSEGFSKPIAGSVSTIVRTYKAAVTRQAGHSPIWQSRFHDHIIRTEEALNIIREYTMNNAVRWQEDMFYS